MYWLSFANVWCTASEALLAGANSGEFEKRQPSNGVTASVGEIILFIDEMHTLVGAGAAGAD